MVLIELKIRPEKLISGYSPPLSAPASRDEETGLFRKIEKIQHLIEVDLFIEGGERKTVPC